MKTVNEPLRAWAWHVALWLALGVTTALIVWVSAWAVYTLGVAAGLTILAVMVIAALGTTTWWISGKARP